jgi:hypothetical protein
MLEQLKTAGLSVVSTYKTLTKAGDALKTVTDKANKDLLALQKNVAEYRSTLHRELMDAKTADEVAKVTVKGFSDHAAFCRQLDDIKRSVDVAKDAYVEAGGISGHRFNKGLVDIIKEDLNKASLMFCLADHVRKVCSYDC